MSNFHLLNEKIKKGIIQKLGWKDLKSVQEKAIPEILDGKNLIVLAPTAGGKTEAAFFPILNKIENMKLNSVSTIYISPIKALLNNQEERLKTLSSFIYEDIFKWHGDVSKTDKKKFIKNPKQILMITPESIEVILMNKGINKEALFGNLHFVVIDEIHALAQSERGTHLLALIERLQKYSKYEIQRIGLSATVGNPEELLNWISGKSSRDKKVIYPDKSKAEKKIEIIKCEKDGSLKNEVIKRVYNRKALVFSNNRRDTEKLKLNLDKAQIKAYVHHSSIDKMFREEAEESFKIGNNSTIVATNTLELGIDIGDLDIVLHIDNPSSVSSFLQKMGRTGRRQNQVSYFVFLPTTLESLVFSVAIMELAIKKWVDNIIFSKKRYDILLHQILTLSLSEFGIEIDYIFDTLNRCYSFSEISEKDYNVLLEYMCKERLINIEKNRIYIGENSEKNLGKMNFLALYSTFETPKEFTVINRGKSIGTVESWYVNALGEKGAFILAGRCWETKKIDTNNYKIYVNETKIANPPKWFSSGKIISYELSQEVLNVLISDEKYPYLNDKEQAILDTYRYEIQEKEIKKGEIKIIENAKLIEITTYMGDRINYTMGSAITLLDDRLELKGVSYLGFAIKKNKSDIKKKEIEDYIDKIRNNTNFYNKDIKEEMTEKLNDFSLSKFQKYLPENLRKKLIADYIFDFRKV